VTKKLVLILHSQGGIEGGLIVDWLLDELPRDAMNKLEVYTFGNAANHFNDPTYYSDYHRTGTGTNSAVAINAKKAPYIEHYCNSGDFVSRWGVLNFIHTKNRYVGRCFVRPGSGHQFNQHYFDNMFPLDPRSGFGASEDNAFMKMQLDLCSHDADDGTDDILSLVDSSDNHADIGQVVRVFSNRGLISATMGNSRRLGSVWQVQDFSRLWLYRNGKSPATDNASA
jgi:hypothetical protein